MAQLLNVLVTLDEIIANNDVIPNSWGKYKRMVANMKKEPGTYKVLHKTSVTQSHSGRRGRVVPIRKINAQD